MKTKAKIIFFNINNKSKDLPVDKFKRKGSKAYRMYPLEAPDTTEIVTYYYLTVTTDVSHENYNSTPERQGLQQLYYTSFH